MLDFQLIGTGDLFISPAGDIAATQSVAQAVSIRLKWFAGEWRLGNALGFPYFEEVFVKNPNLAKIQYLLRDLVLAVDGVTGVTGIEIKPDVSNRRAAVRIAFLVGEDTYRKELTICG